MKNNYLSSYTAPFRRLCGLFLLGLLLLCLFLPAALRAQPVTVQPAPGYALLLQSFGNVPVNRTSALQSILVSGDNLTGNVTVAAPEGFKMRTGNNAFSTTSLVFSPAAGTLSDMQVDIRFAPVASGTRPDGTGNYAAGVVVSTPSGGSTASEMVATYGTAPAGHMCLFARPRWPLARYPKAGRARC